MQSINACACKHVCLCMFILLHSCLFNILTYCISCGEDPDFPGMVLDCMIIVMILNLVLILNKSSIQFKFGFVCFWFLISSYVQQESYLVTRKWIRRKVLNIWILNYGFCRVEVCLGFHLITNALFYFISLQNLVILVASFYPNLCYWWFWYVALFIGSRS